MRWLALLCVFLVGCAPIVQADDTGPRPTLTIEPTFVLAPTNESRTPVPYPAPIELQATPPSLTAVWQGAASLHVTWVAPGWHCLRLDSASLDCRSDSADLLLRTGGVDHLYAPKPGQTLRLINYGGNITAQVVVPARLYRVIVLPVLR